MRKCSNCGAEVPDTAKFCRSCGTKIMDPEDMTVILDGDHSGADIPAGGAEEVFPGGGEGYPGGNESYPGGNGGYQGGNGYNGGGFQGGNDFQGGNGYNGGGYQGGNGYDGFPGGNGHPGGNGYNGDNTPGGGYPRGGGQGGGRQGGGYPGGGRPVAMAPEWDHTREFDAKDVSENKAVAMLVYLLGFLGIIMALLAGTTSPYAGFHVRQGMKFVVLDTLIAIVALLFFLIMIPFSAGSVLGGYGGGYMDTDMALGGLAGIGIFAVVIYFLLGAFTLILGIVKIICFFSICKGEAKEPPIVRSFGFLK